MRNVSLSGEARKLTAENVAAIRRLREAGHSYEEIHNLTGFSDATISKYAKDAQPKAQPRPQTPGQREPVVPVSSATVPDGFSGKNEQMLRVAIDPDFLLGAVSMAYSHGCKTLKEFWETVALPSIRFAHKIGEWIPHRPKDYDDLYNQAVSLFQDGVVYREKVAAWRKDEWERALRNDRAT